MEGDKRILLVAQKSAETDDPGADRPVPIGTLAQVLQLLKLPDGTIKVLVEGVQRAQGRDRRSARKTARCRRQCDVVPVAARAEVEPREVDAIAQFEQYVKLNKKSCRRNCCRRCPASTIPGAWPTPSPRTWASV
jgi:ATP-dependent Lon protease